jgi:hypothetical protein
MSQEEAETTISLPETNLRVTSSDLIQEENGKVVASWEIAKIGSIHVRRVLNPFSVALIGSACGTLYLRWALGLGTFLTILLYLLVGAMMLIGLIMITSLVIRFEYPYRDQVEIECQDSEQAVREFVQVVKRHHEKA